MGDFYVADFQVQADEFGVVVFSQIVSQVDDDVLLDVYIYFRSGWGRAFPL